MKLLNILAMILVIAGALNWGLWGVFQFDFIAWIAHGNTTKFARLLYSLFGLAGIWSLGWIGKWKCLCGCCGCNKSGSQGGGCCK